MLSHSTLSKFRGELQRRKSERLRAVKREQKADKVARVKSEKDEQRQRRELLGYNYLYGGTRQQTIDPDDEFFQAPAASFDELEEGVQQNRSATFQFNDVCAAGGVWPELLSPPNRGHQEVTTTAVSPIIITRCCNGSFIPTTNQRNLGKPQAQCRCKSGTSGC